MWRTFPGTLTPNLGGDHRYGRCGVEAVHGDLEAGLERLNTTIDTYHRAGNISNEAAALACLAVFINRFDRPEIATTVLGAPPPTTTSSG